MIFDPFALCCVYLLYKNTEVGCRLCIPAISLIFLCRLNRLISPQIFNLVIFFFKVYFVFISYLLFHIIVNIFVFIDILVLVLSSSLHHVQDQLHHSLISLSAFRRLLVILSRNLGGNILVLSYFSHYH